MSQFSAASIENRDYREVKPLLYLYYSRSLIASTLEVVLVHRVAAWLQVCSQISFV